MYSLSAAARPALRILHLAPCWQIEFHRLTVNSLQRLLGVCAEQMKAASEGTLLLWHTGRAVYSCMAQRASVSFSIKGSAFWEGMTMGPC
jgi:hypothetical protein